MKASYYLGGLALGLIVGSVVGYAIATDPKKRRKINSFLNDVNDKVDDLKERVKATVGCCCEEELTDEEISEIESILNAEAEGIE